jgi:hypothetical protein
VAEALLDGQAGRIGHAASPWVRQRILAGTAFASYNDTVSHLTDEGMT